jgi:lysophospholipase L1-like esterase
MSRETAGQVDSDGRRKLLFALTIFVAVLTGWMFGRNAERERFFAEAAASPLPTAPVPLSRPGCSIWFIGSSSIANWRTMPEDMAPWEARNRGIGGATMREITQRFQNEPDGAKPAAIVYYAGENDIAFGGTTDRAITDLQAFVAAKRKRYGAMKVLILSLKPSPTRWDERPLQIEFNKRSQALVASQPDLAFLDIEKLLLVGGRPGPYYRDDGIHLNADGYRVWARAIDGALPKLLPDAVNRCAIPATRA